jgi:DNA invertase Pin-like site-specific DNA recombinase
MDKNECMRIFAYCYTDPLLEPPPHPQTWDCQLDRVFEDVAVDSILPESHKTKKSENSSNVRSQWRQLVECCQQDPPDFVLVRQLEELGASLQEVGDRLAALETLGIPLITLEDLNPADSSSSVETFSVETLPKDLDSAALQQLQTLQHEQRSRRIQHGHARNRVKALPPPGKAPYGYRRGKTSYVVDRSTAPVVKDFFEQFLLYGSLRSAVRYLAKRYSKKISASTGQRWLTNAVYRGDLAYHDGQVIRDTHTAIISRDEAAQVDRLLRRNRQLAPRSASAPRSLAGLVFCGQCQSSMTVTRVTAHRKAQEYLYLRPTRCTQQPKCGAIAYEQVLQTTIQRICEDLPKAVAGVELPDMQGIKQRLADLIASKQSAITQLPPLIASGILDQPTADLRTYTLRAEMAQLQDQLAQLPPVDLQATTQTVSLPQFWLDLSEPERRFYFREFIRQIFLHRNGAEWELQFLFLFDRSRE